MDDDVSRLKRARQFFKEQGVKCTCLRAYLIEGNLHVETPTEIAFMDLEDKRRIG